MSALLPVEDALAQVLASASAPVTIVRLPLLEALGLVLAEDVVSPIDVPLNDNSAMDGYALRADDARRELPVSQRIAAGSVGRPLDPGSAARIFTGAPIPQGADAVAMQEDCDAGDDRVTVRTSMRVGQNIRPRGQDIASGELVLTAGRQLLPQDIGLLASVGLAEVGVFKPLRVAILSTGDELLEPGSGELRSGQLYNSNRYTLAASLQAMKIDVVDGGIVPDNAEATAEALVQAAKNADCVITSGGVSVGEEDHVKSQVERLGRLDLWKLAIKPGKPLAFGNINGTPFFGLPGNPTSVFVTFNVIARPYLRRLQGISGNSAISLTARAGFTRDKPGSRQEYLRVQLSSDGGALLATPFDNQSSGVLSSVSRSNALAIIPVGATVQPGDSIEVLPLENLYG